MATGLIAALGALGVMALLSGVYRGQRRAATSRRVATVLAEASLEGTPVGFGMEPPPSRVQLEVRQLLGQIETHDTLLRVPTIAVGCLCGLIGLSTASPGWFVLAAVATWAAYFLGGRQRRRQRVEAQALEAMSLFASGLRAGYSVPQAIAMVAKHSLEPTASEFALAAQEISLGMQLADAMMRLSKRTANPDYALVAIIIRVQHEVGGNLAQILDSVGTTLRDRFELRQQVNALTAQQRLSSMVLTFLPFGLLMFLFVVDRSFVDPLLTEPVGRLLLVIAGVMVFLGWTIMRSVGRVDV